MAKTRKQKKGGAIIGQGKSGVVHYPALDCFDPAQQPLGNVVSKVVPTMKNAMADYRISKKIREKGYDFICPTIDACRKKPTNITNSSWLVFSQHCGIPLRAATNEIRKQVEDINTPNFTDFYAFLDALDLLRENIQKMNNDFIYHNDITMDNILYNSSIKKAYLIDFERASVETEEDKEANDLLLFDTVYEIVQTIIMK
jgi:hypothetical protein